MQLIENNLQDSFVLKPTLHADARGYFFESYSQLTFEKLSGQKVHFVQDNQAKSNKGVLRGLHYQTGNSAQAKLVSVIKGSVLYVIVYMIKNSNTIAKNFDI